MNRILPACTCVLLLALLGCAPVKSRVSYVEPAPGEEILNALPTIRVGFDRPMDPGTVNQDTFLVQGSESGAHSGDIVLDPRNTEVTFTPHDPFAAGELITVILKDDIRSQSGKFLKEYRWEFRLLPPPEVELPAFELVSLDPGIESTIAPRLTSITATFSDPYNPFAAAPSSVVVEGERSGAREIAFENLFTGGDALRMTVGRPFLAGESVSVAITPTLTSAAGAPAAAALVRFTVKNAGSLWPEAPHAQGAGLAPGGGLLFLDADADGVDEWALVHPDGLVEAQDASAGDPGPVVSWTLPQGTIDAAAGDFDGDGRADLVCLATDGATLYLFRGAQSISLLLLDPQVITFPGASAVAVAGGHFDEDGVRDLFIRENGGARIAWGGASTPLLTSTELPGIEASAPAAAGDLDGDDLVDIACPLPSGDVQILWGTGERTFPGGPVLSPQSRAAGVLAASLSGDDLVDLVALAEPGLGPTLFSPNGDGSFSTILLDTDVAVPGTISCDWDGDGALDLLAPVAGSAAVRLSTGLGDGHFTPSKSHTVAFEVSEIRVGDANGDGILDLALAGVDGSWEIGLATPSVPLLTNRLEIPDVAGDPGSSGIPYEVIADHEVTLDGYTIVIGFDPLVITVESISSLGTDAGAIGVEFELPQIDPVAGVVILAAIIDFLPPYDGQDLPPAAGDVIAAGSVGIAAGAGPGSTPLALTNDLGSPPSSNTFVAAGISIAPDLAGGSVIVSGSAPPVAEFVRGDVNGSGNVDLSDATGLQSYLLGSGPPVSCLDAADANDDGTVNMADPVYLYDFLFGGGPTPPLPYPYAGTDGTPDGLDCGE